MKEIKGYTKSEKKYKKISKNKNYKLTEQKSNKLTKVFKKIREILREIIKLILIFSLVNVMQLILVKDTTFMLIKYASYYIQIFGDEIFYKYLIISIGDGIIKFVATILVIFAIFLMVNAISNKKKTSIIFTLSFIYLYSMANYIITKIRGSSLTLYDILSIKTALNVADNINFTIDIYMIIATCIFVITILLVLYLYQKCQKIKKKTRIFSAILSILILCVIISSQLVKSIGVWDMKQAYSENGVVLTLLKLTTNLIYEVPEDYKKEEIEEMLAGYKMTEDSECNSNSNIIVVINESFTDYTQNSKVEISEDNIPYFHTLQKQENTITGTMHSSSFRGRNC